jgi:tetrahydromethanopterin S-methyltransferase subunit B
MSINNVVSESNMAENESDWPEEAITRWMTNLEERINRLERIIDALNRRLEGSERHPEDEGWFD